MYYVSLFYILKAIQYYIEALENSDQAVRIGACIALGQLKVTPEIITIIVH